MSKSPNKPVELEDLLKLKRHESPDADFWEQFDQDFERRRLRALMGEDSVPEKVAAFRWVRGILFGGAGFASAAAAVWVLAFQAGTLNFAQFGQETPDATAIAQSLESQPVSTALSQSSYESAPRVVVQLASTRPEGSAEFIVDALTAESESRGFESIHANPVFSGQSHGSAQFVTDPYYGGDRFEPTFTVDRAIARF